jgi:hypothetical protein
MRTPRLLIALLAIAPACLAQKPTWTPECPATRPPARYAHDVAYDTARGQVVLFGGADPSTNTSFNDTWVSDGTNWTQKFPTSSPPPKTAHAMTYDAARGQVVLFGGFSNGVPSADTWVWDGTNWAQKFPATSPPTSVFVGMTYDSVRQQVVLFGAGVYPNVLADTWVWDGVNWTQKFPATSPPARIDHRLAFDVARGNVLLFGSWNGVTSLDDTWTWDGSNWTQQLLAASPASRFSYGIAYDAGLQQTVLFGGEHCDDSNCGSQAGSPAPSFFNDTWTWDGTTWAQQLQATSPPVTTLPGMAYDQARSQIVLFGGSNGSSVVNSTWVWGTTASISCPTILSILPTSGLQGQTISNFIVNGTNIQTGASLSFSGDAGVQVNSTVSTATQMTANISIAIVAATGARDVIVTNPDGGKATLRGKFTVDVALPPPLPAILVYPTACGHSCVGTPLDFGTVPPKGMSPAQSLTVQNTGTAPLQITGYDNRHSAFEPFSAQLALQPVLNPGQSALIWVTFSPSGASIGEIKDVLTITSNVGPATFEPMMGICKPRKSPLLLLPMDYPVPNSILDITPINNRQVGDTIVSGFIIRNFTGTWFEISLDTSSPPPAAPSLVSFNAQQIPNASSFMIGPNETLHAFPRNGQPLLNFFPGQYLKFSASDRSLKANGAFALDMLIKGLFGVGLRSAELSVQVLSQMADNIGGICSGNARQMMSDAVANNPQAVAWDDILLLGCLVQTSAALVDEIANMLTKKLGADAAATWRDIAPALGKASVGLPLAINFFTLDVPMAFAQFTVPYTGYVLLELPLPGH